MGKGGCVKKVLLGSLVGLVLLVLGVLVLVKSRSKPLPEGQPGERAEALAQAMLAAIDHKSWELTGGVMWNFGGRQEHMWDRQRHFAQVRWDGYEVLVDLSKRTGVAKVNGTRIYGEEAEILVRKAWAHWANDSFWLNPISKIYDEGVSRSYVEMEDGLRGLLVTYASGGVTPGDSYLWVVDENDLPVRWEMWVSIIPIGGFEATWTNWTTLSTGVKVSQTHDLGVAVLELTDIRAGATLSEMVPGDDPFEELL